MVNLRGLQAILLEMPGRQVSKWGALGRGGVGGANGSGLHLPHAWDWAIFYPTALDITTV